MLVQIINPQNGFIYKGTILDLFTREQGADQILVIEAGKLVEAGTHEQLLKKEGVYEKYWNISMQ